MIRGDIKRLSVRLLSSRGKSTSPPERLAPRKVMESSEPKIQFENVAKEFPFSRARIGQFFQEQPTLGNQFLGDAALISYLKRVMPPQIFAEVSPDLERFGQRVVTDIYDLHLQCDRELPKLQHYDAYGKRVDNIITCDAWKAMKRIAAEEGLVSIGYERKQGPFSRLYQLVKVYLFNSSSGLYSCPLAMTDGAAKCLEVIGEKQLLGPAFENLISRDPAKFWTSGQWMTERKGGSDVGGGTETLAIPVEDGTYKLYGYKWFSSATDSDMTLTLARVVDDLGRTRQGSKGLSMFYLETRDEQGNLNNMEIQRLKDKLGTRQVPTAELLLDGAVAHRISEDGRGVAGIVDMLKMTRIHNAISSASCMRRILSFSRDFSQKRMAFGKKKKVPTATLR